MTEPSEAVRVVIVDDSSSIRAALSALLDTVPTTEVIGEAVNGAEGVQMVLERRPDVVVMDMQMPVMDGIEAARQILNQWPRAQILMNSAYTDEALVAEAMSYGIKEYLSKDLRPGKLVRAIVALGHLARHDEVLPTH